MLSVFSTLKQSAVKAIFCTTALFASAASYGQSWTNPGSDGLGISTGAVTDISMVVKGTGHLGPDTVYVVYKDATGALTAQWWYTGSTSWLPLGPPSFAATARSPKIILANGTPDIAFSWGATPHLYKANVQTFSSGSWSAFAGGTDISSGSVSNIVFDWAGGTNYYIGYSDSNTNIATFKKFSGGSFVPIGTASTGAATYLSMTHYNANTPLCLSIDAGSSNLPTAKYYNGTSWLDIGSAVSSSTAAYCQIASNGVVTYAVFSDFGSSKQDVCYKFSGDPSTASWTSVGGISGFTTDEADYNSLAIEPSTSNPAVAFSRATNGKANLMHWNGTNWTSVGPADFSDGAATYTVLGINGGGDYFVAYADAAHGGKLVVKRLDNPTAIPNSPKSAIKLQVYPNPANSSFTVKGTSKGIYTITNEIGQTVKSIELNASNNYTITINNLNSGVYFIKGNNGVNQKVVITK